jgi:hypothetical protein
MTELPSRDASRPLRIGNCSGFWGDRMSAMREMLTGGPLDILTGDYLAELTMLLLFRARAKDSIAGYVPTFLQQLEDCLDVALERGVRIVVNAGGLNPAGCAAAVGELAARQGLDVAVAYVEGDDVLSARGVPEGAITANAYLGCWPIAAALAGGAQIVITGRCTDAALVCGPAAWWYGWAREDWNALAGAVVAGHVLECGAQATGGNYPYFDEVAALEHPGFPIAEIAADGSSMITKHPGTGGTVSVGTVTAQLLYEISGPAYPGPDVTALFDTIQLTECAGGVRISGVRGAPPPPTLKVCTNRVGGYRNHMTFGLTGLNIPAKAQLVRRTLEPILRGIEEVTWDLSTHCKDAVTEQDASALLTVHVKDVDKAKVGRRFSSHVVEIGLSSYPGFFVTTPPRDATWYGIYSPAYLDPMELTPTVWHPDGRREVVEHTLGKASPGASEDSDNRSLAEQLVVEPTLRLPLGRVVGARSGDKGGDANIGVWGRGPEAHRWLRGYLTPERVRELLPETARLDVLVHDLPNLNAINIVIAGLLGDGVASSVRFDPQAKGLGEWLRSRLVPIPERLLC